MASILLTLVAAAATLSWIVLFLSFIAMAGFRARYLLFVLAPILSAGALGLSVAIRILARRTRGRTSMSVASILLAATFVLLALNSWEWYRIQIGETYCTACVQFFYLPLLGILAAVGGISSEVVGIRLWWTEQRRPPIVTPERSDP